jgi:hypothetical protein
MPESLHATAGRIQENNGVDSAYFFPPTPTERGIYGPPDADGRPTGEPTPALPYWLWRLTIPGAPLVPILDVPHAPGPGCVPFLRGRVPLDLRPVGGQAMAASRDGALALGWPRAQRDAEILALVPAGQHRWPRRDGPRARAARPRWYAEAAYFRDLGAETEVEVAQRLDLGDDTLRGEDGSRAARYWIAQGRERLAAIGAWPWCLSPAGRLPADWYREPRFAVALGAWHRESFVAMVGDSLRGVQYAAGDRSDTRYAPGNHEAALQLYAAQFP